MATWVLGDIHGRFAALEALWPRLGFDRERDVLWLVGDLVNRGPHSLEVLRWARRLDAELGGRMTAVLGNHDLHLLAFAAGVGRPKARDTLDEILTAPDREELVDWLRRRPLIHRRGEDVLVHAGLYPSWTLKEAEARAREAEAVLRGPDAAALLADWRVREPVEGPARERHRFTLAVLASIRCVDGKGRLSEHDGPPQTAPPSCLPWFAFEGRPSAAARIVFGHWAALGLYREPRILALDSGAAWAGQLTAVRLDDGVVVQEEV